MLAFPTHAQEDGSMSETSNKTRLEHDCIGQMEVPANVYWGIHTQRAIGNFPVSGITDSQHPELIRAYATVKRACAIANEELGLIEPSQGRGHSRRLLEIGAGQTGRSVPGRCDAGRCPAPRRT